MASLGQSSVSHTRCSFWSVTKSSELVMERFDVRIVLGKELRPEVPVDVSKAAMQTFRRPPH